VLAPKGASFFGQDQDDTVVVPYTSAMKRVLGGEGVPRITVSVERGKPMAAVQEQISDLLLQRHRIASDRDADFTIRTQEELATMATATSSIMTTLLGFVASISDRRRDRHHEYHAGERHGTHPGDRDPPGHRRARQ